MHNFFSVGMAWSRSVTHRIRRCTKTTIDDNRTLEKPSLKHIIVCNQEFNVCVEDRKCDELTYFIATHDKCTFLIFER